MKANTSSPGLTSSHRYLYHWKLVYSSECKHKVWTSLASKCTPIDCVTDCNGLLMTITLTLETRLLSMGCPICYPMASIHSKLNRNKGPIWLRTGRRMGLQGSCYWRSFILLFCIQMGHAVITGINNSSLYIPQNTKVNSNAAWASVTHSYILDSVQLGGTYPPPNDYIILQLWCTTFINTALQVTWHVVSVYKCKFCSNESRRN